MSGHKLEISKTYLKFFVKNIDSRWVLCQGGRRSGKSFASIRWLWFMASAYPNSTILMVAASYPALQNLIQDFQRATPLTVEGSQTYGFNCKLSNGSRFIFKSFDDYTKAQGTTCDFLFLEEALNIPMNIITTLSMSVTKQIFCCFNPTRKTDLEKYVLPDRSNLLITTWKDNDYLTDSQKEEFHEIERRAKLPTASIMDIYHYKVYCLGEYAEMTGKVFRTVFTCTDDEFDRIPIKPLYGLDFGFVENGDMTAMTAVKIYDGCLYIKEILYDNQSLVNDKKLAIRLAEEGISVYDQIVADMGGFGKTRIHNLITACDGEWSEPDINKGFTIANAKKGKVLEGIETMLGMERIYVTESSRNLRDEMDGYEISPAGTPQGADHLIDSARYATVSYRTHIW